MVETSAADFALLTELERYELFLRLYRSPDEADQERLRALYRSPDPLVPLILLPYLEDLPEKRAMAAVIGLIEEGVEIVSRSAMAAYLRSHYPGKARMLKQLLLSSSPRACRFAVRTLSRAGFAEALPLLLRELPDREPEVRAEMILALRYLPDRRVLPVLAPLASSEDEPTRYLATRVLAELQPRLKRPGAGFFARRSHDESERVRRVALEALQRFPSRRVAPLILSTALDGSAPEEDRVRALRALAAFPSRRWARPLAAVAAAERSPALRLAAEIALRAFPSPALRAGLEPLLEVDDGALRRQAALFLAELLGDDKRVRARLLEAWRRSPEERAVELVDALRALPGEEAEAALAEAALRGPLLAYAAAGALALRRGPGAGRRVLALLARPDLDEPLRQTLLDRYARRGPDEGGREQLLPLLGSLTGSPNVNVRYLTARALGWYPPEQARGPLLGLLAVESDHSVARAAEAALARGLDRDPRALLEAALAHPGRERLAGAVFRVVIGAGWDPAAADGVVAALAGPEGLLAGKPRALAAAFVHLFEHGTAPLPRLWGVMEERGHEALLLRFLAAALRNPRRALPPLPLAFLESRLRGAPPRTRALHYELLGADGRNQALKDLLALLARETDADARARGRAQVRRLLAEEPR